MYDNKFILPICNGFEEVHGFPMFTYSDWYTITSDGKKAMWDKGNLLITRIISLIALLISFLALLINFYKM